MREIKFRAWDKKENKMLSGPPHRNTNIQKWVIKHWEMSLNSEYVLMQYTGLKDKNGKEIYEGDIVKHRKLNSALDIASYGLSESLIGDEAQVVEYKHFGFSPMSGWIDGAQEDLEWEIIGNIYENPELLK